MLCLTFLFLLHGDLSPPESREAHFVLTLDLRDFDSHSKCVQEVLNEFGKVSVLFCVVHVHLHEITVSSVSCVA